MFIKFISKQSKRSQHEIVSGALFQCDVCEQQFERWYKSVVQNSIEACANYCSRACLNSDWGNRLRIHNLKNYGVENVSSAPAVQIKRHATMNERYGVSEPFSSPKIVAQRAENLESKYGTTKWSQISFIQKKMSESAIRRNAAMSAAEKSAWRQQISATMKIKGSYRSSHPEDACYAFLCEKYQSIDVERQVTLTSAPKNWVIDFHIKSQNLYIQVDGIYWHGLNRQIDIIESSSSLHDVFIAARWHDDRTQDKWFAAAGLKLVRVTDKDVKSGVFRALV